MTGVRFGLAARVRNPLVNYAYRVGWIESRRNADQRLMYRLAMLPDHELIGVPMFGPKALDEFRRAYPVVAIRPDQV